MQEQRYIEIIENEDTISIYPLSCFDALIKINNSTAVCIDFRNVSFTIVVKESYREVKNMLLGNVKTITLNRVWVDGDKSDISNVLPFTKT